MSANPDRRRQSPTLAALARAAARLAWRVGRAAWLALAAAAWAQGGAPIPVADFSAAPGSGVYGYASSTPRNLADLVDPQRPRPPATVRAQWLLPAGGGAKLPAVVLVHGSGGVYPELATFWARRLNEHSIAALIIDIFGPRGVTSTVEDQAQVPFAADVADAFAALRLLSTHPRIDPSRIAIMGFSRGGTAAWRTAVARIAAGASPGGLRYAAHIAVYSGGCAGALSVAVKPGVFGPAPLLFIHGEDDDYAYASECRDFAQRIAAAGTPAEYLGLPGARHKFDADNPRRIPLPRAVKTKQGCPLELDIDSLVVRDRRSGAALGAEQVQAVQRELCHAVGASIEGDRGARDAAAQAVDALLKRVFGS